MLVEVNCETDFVARGEKFRELVNDMAMQVGKLPVKDGLGGASGVGGGRAAGVPLLRAGCRGACCTTAVTWPGSRAVSLTLFSPRYPRPPPPVCLPQIAACADVRYVSAADVPAALLEKEKAIEMEKEDIKSKPEQIRCVLRCAVHAVRC